MIDWLIDGGLQQDNHIKSALSVITEGWRNAEALVMPTYIQQLARSG